MTTPTATATANPLATIAGQSWLTGAEVYLRPVVPADADDASAWRASPFPLAPARAREWITDELAKRSDPYESATYLIVRRHDERPVGSVAIDLHHFPQTFLTMAMNPLHMNPLHGEERLRWQAEAAVLVFRMLVDEQQRPKAAMSVPADETVVIEALEAIGARVTVRFREKLAVPGEGRRDEVIVEYLHPAWVERLGDPAGIALTRTGTGQPRPVTAPVLLDGDPPANAIRVGPRVYLRPPQEFDARAIAHWSLREIDPSWENGRHPFGTASAAEWIASWQKKTPPRTINLAVCLRETDEFLGLAGMLEVNYRHRFGESASMIMNPAFREAEYGSEAKHLMFDYLFNDLDLHAIQSWVMFENPRSAAALRKQGYREAGREHWIEHRDGRFVSFVAFDLLATDWRAMPRHVTDTYP